jgi:hypothetical protein
MRHADEHLLWQPSLQLTAASSHFWILTPAAQMQLAKGHSLRSLAAFCQNPTLFLDNRLDRSGPSGGFQRNSESSESRCIRWTGNIEGNVRAEK